MNEERNFDTVKKSKARYLILIILFIAISVFSLMAISHFVNDQSFVLSFDILSKAVIIQLIAIMPVYFLMDALRLYYILKSIGVNVSLGYIAKLTFINIFISNVTPFATGGGIAQIHFLTKKNVHIADATAATSIRTAIPLIFFSVTAPLILIFNKSIVGMISSRHTALYTLILVSINFITVLVLYLLIKNPKQIKRFLVYSTIHLRRRRMIKTARSRQKILYTLHSIDRFSSNIKRYLKGQRKYLMLSILSTFGFLSASFSFTIVLIKGLSASSSTISILLSQIVVTYFMYFAPTPGATGIAEGGFTHLFKNFVQSGEIVTITFMWRFFTIYVGLALGAILFYYEVFKTENSNNH
ncbi:MAG: lysylphosphatidylglycerol synthase transmembrane domain-containing protein [Eubacteriales bacterium]|nr:lysylphosphatidylglycerol synthase transmembrane domain-containing protein [Eubacteriales bacterium]